MTRLPDFAAPDAGPMPLYLSGPEGAEAVLAGLPAPAAAWARATGWAGARGDLRLLPGDGGAISGALFGLGGADSRRRDRFLVARAATALPPGTTWQIRGLDDPAARDEAALGWLLAAYRFARYRGGADATVAGLVPPAGVDAARLHQIAAAEWLTRDLINTPANDMGPAELETEFRNLANLFGAQVAVIRGADLLSHGFPVIHAVGRASPRQPRVMSLTWGHRGPLVTLVGKGVCFDTGGLDIKPSSGMLNMKKDMGGAATTMGLAQMIMAADLPLRLRLIVPAVDNAISGDAMRPRDILRGRKGLTIEVNNTDAEGRLVLSDALTWACEDRPDLLVCMATLTGAARVALGPDLAPFYTDDDGLAAALAAAGARVRDPVWRLPFWESYETMIEPGIADLDNSPTGGFAGSIVAALFLRRFVDVPRFLHFDIFAHQPADAPGRPVGGVGQGARALFDALPGVLGL